jgi:hypothetical protein
MNLGIILVVTIQLLLAPSWVTALQRAEAELVKQSKISPIAKGRILARILKPGMRLEEVERIVGYAPLIAGDGQSMDFRYPEYGLTVTFVLDKVESACVRTKGGQP